jgi:integrase/recombinase XerD
MSAIITTEAATFEQVIQQVRNSVESAASARVYAHTLNQWVKWSAAHSYNPLDLSYKAVSEYLDELEVSKSTKQRQLSTLRKAARVVAAVTGDNRFVEQLTLLKIQRVEGSGRERNKIALNPKQIYDALNAWSGHRLIDRRNRAILAVLFFTGLRRSEAAVLKWSDINFEAGILTVRHGKGDKSREVAILGDFAVGMIREWQTLQTDANNRVVREYVFSPINKGSNMGNDKPITADAIWRVVKQTGVITGVDFAPHDARRSLATDALSNGTPVPDVQAQLGHSDASVTLRYAQKADAKVRRSRMKLSY